LDFSQFISYIASGTVYTVGVTLIALPSGLLFGTILALLYVYGGKVAARLMNLYSTIFRGIPH
jgi:His/Glu/Gln/Arg/opine family amino acid ABC transporter permease subunit